MSEFDLTEDLPPEERPEPASPEDYEPEEPESPETGTVYDPEGEPAQTPQDRKLLEADEDDE